MDNKRKEILVVAIFIVIQIIIYIFAGIQKSYIHMDEAFSLGLASYERTQIQDNDDFYNNWHTRDYYEDYLSVQDDEVGKYEQVYENQKNDVHPPLYYLILRFAMGFNLNQYSKWPGLIINIIIYTFITLFMYFILQKILDEEPNAKEKSIILAFISSITMASLTNVLYIRMYALSALEIIITVYLHIKLFENKKENPKLLTLIGISVLAGILTHYYYIFFLAILYIIFAIRYIKQKQYKQLVDYTVTMLISGIMSLIIFPYSIQHMFFGDRGVGVIHNLTNISKFLENIGIYILTLNYYGFNNLLLLILILMLYIYRKSKKDGIKYEKNEFIKIIALSVLFYFIIAAIASPYTELRYIMPVCGLIFILVIYYLYKILNVRYNEKKSNLIIGSILIIMLIAPAIFKIEPGVLYSDKKEIVKELGNELNLPTVYFLNGQNNRFLDDILLFTELDESYVAKDIEYTESNIKEIFKNVDISNGIVIFVNYDNYNSDILDFVMETMNFSSYMHLKRLNACDVYYMK